MRRFLFAALIALLPLAALAQNYQPYISSNTLTGNQNLLFSPLTGKSATCTIAVTPIGGGSVDLSQVNVNSFSTTGQGGQFLNQKLYTPDGTLIGTDSGTVLVTSYFVFGCPNATAVSINVAASGQFTYTFTASPIAFQFPVNVSAFCAPACAVYFSPSPPSWPLLNGIPLVTVVATPNAMATTASITTKTSTLLLAGVAGQKTLVYGSWCEWVTGGVGGLTCQLAYATSGNCPTSTTPISPAYSLDATQTTGSIAVPLWGSGSLNVANSAGVGFNPTVWGFPVPAGDDVCIITGGSGTMGTARGWLFYWQGAGQ